MKKIVSIRKNVYDKIKMHITGFKTQFVNLGALKIVLILLGLTSPFLFKILIDDVMVKRQLNMLKWVCIGYAGIYLLETAVTVYQKIISNRVFSKITFDIRYKLLRNYVKMPVTFYEKYNTGDLKNRIDTDVDVFERFFNQQIIEYIFNWMLVLINGIVLIILCWKLALFGLLMVPLSFWMTRWLGKGVEKSSEEYRKTWGKYENWLQRSIQGWKEVKALSIEKNESRIFTSFWHDLSIQFFKRQMFWYGNRSFISLKDFFITRMNLYFIGGLLIFSGELSIGSLLVFMKYYEQFFSGIGSINNLDMQISNDIPAMERVLEVISYPMEAREISKNKLQLAGDIEIMNVSFKYNDSHEDVLKNINIKIKPKERIAIVGKSGCGKSSLIKNILGLYEPQAGKILIDGVNIKNINPFALHQNIGVVMQDSMLFNMTVKDNLLLAKASATDEEIKEVCKMAFIDEFIESLPEGYMTLIGEKGVKLSGGQKQRLAIARVLLTKPNIIIFDEATSSLDHESEKMINKAIDNLSNDRTLIIIAHRLSSVLSADRIIVMDKGGIVGDAPHGKLLGNNEIYDLLFGKQYEGLQVS
ncbi:MAG: ABC transporter ATP-binding protein/permease [Clostridia bacterium]|nr:ABC transporter ATP-binding protein/permease [Clostridia bacterium]